MRGIVLQTNATRFAPPTASIEVSTTNFLLKLSDQDRPPNPGGDDTA
jgi:hypothetical protein